MSSIGGSLDSEKSGHKGSMRSRASTKEERSVKESSVREPEALESPPVSFADDAQRKRWRSWELIRTQAPQLRTKEGDEAKRYLANMR